MTILLRPRRLPAECRFKYRRVEPGYATSPSRCAYQRSTRNVTAAPGSSRLWTGCMQRLPQTRGATKQAENCWKTKGGKEGIAMLGKAAARHSDGCFSGPSPASRSRRNPIDDEWGAERGRDASGQEGKRRPTGPGSRSGNGEIGPRARQVGQADGRKAAARGDGPRHSRARREPVRNAHLAEMTHDTIGKSLRAYGLCVRATFPNTRCAPVP
jgi:hypothetical protein